MGGLKRSAPPFSSASRPVAKGSPSAEDDFAALIKRFIEAEKSIPMNLRWRESKNHADYAISVMRVACPKFSRIKARVVLNSHIYFEPRKYTFVLLLNRTRIVALDVGPKRFHRNAFGASIGCTHWQYYPTYEAIPDDRLLSHYQWLDLFFKRCNIVFEEQYTAPMHDKEQMRLGL